MNPGNNLIGIATSHICLIIYFQNLNFYFQKKIGELKGSTDYRPASNSYIIQVPVLKKRIQTPVKGLNTQDLRAT
jgi:hypothetical protein